MHRATTAVIFVIDASLIFCSNKVGQQVIPIPAFSASRLPIGVILAVPADVNHAVDGGGAPQHFAPRHHESSTASPFFRLCHVTP